MLQIFIDYVNLWEGNDPSTFQNLFPEAHTDITGYLILTNIVEMPLFFILRVHNIDFNYLKPPLNFV